ncbi:MAG: MqnA/MqnD/SBP family protein, partial [Candidatus Methylomirabilia bacterium]
MASEDRVEASNSWKVTLRVGRIPYLNCEPFFAYLEGVEMLTVSPRALGEAMAAGRLDAGPVPLADV